MIQRYAAAYLMRRSRYYIAVHEGLEKCASKQCGEAVSCCSCTHYTAYDDGDLRQCKKYLPIIYTL